MKIIIVEDDKVLSLLLSKMIEKLGYEVLAIVTKGKEAIAKIQELSADIVLMDVMLEDDVDGIDAMLTLRENGNDIPVVYITGNSDPVNYKRAQKTNFEEYLIKPVSFDQLRFTLAQLEK